MVYNKDKQLFEVRQWVMENMKKFVNQIAKVHTGIIITFGAKI